MERLNEYLAEQWKGIVGYPDYEVSTHGRVRRITDSMHKRAGELVACLPNYEERRVAALGENRHFYVSNLVAAAFLGQKPIGCEVHHIDEDRTNDWLYNLEYKTIHTHKLIHARTKTTKKLTAEDVEEIRLFHLAGLSSTEIACKFCVSSRYVREIIEGRKRKEQ